eukprot:TRINITY_DN361_c0_g1_i1.p1 TRINITY_DN361_c0_g1~~TRINITY_DN361_c0_g1_i1.p1  ORF type:complete len:833 (+),score=188.73 TRINITY_DN361_c0_g1_i1:138-2501(+)
MAFTPSPHPLRAPLILLSLAFLAVLSSIGGVTAQFYSGVGSSDITGTPAGCGMMGYAMLDQKTAGLQMRQRARAFIFESAATNSSGGGNSTRIVFVSADLAMVFLEVKLQVVQNLQNLYGPTLYTDANVMISATHTHAGPGGFSYFPLYDITTMGFHKLNFAKVSDGITAAIVMAHESFDSTGSGGDILASLGHLMDSNANRSPTSYLLNPASERANYGYDIDKNVTVLRIKNSKGEDIGMIDWFAVHGTSLNNTNPLISGDNKGHASQLFEATMNTNNTSGQPFVAAFGQSNEGDVSPNTKGAFCTDGPTVGQPCEALHSTCGGLTEGCQGYGPGATDLLSMEMIGQNQFEEALKLFLNASIALSGEVSYVHTYVNMSNVLVSEEFSPTGKAVTTCRAALGDGFAAGTTDGPGMFNFVQGTNLSTTNPFWNYLGEFATKANNETIVCHEPKQILLDVGRADIPAQWSPEVLPLQIFRLGQLFIIGVPGEFTTMSGRRLRESVRSALGAAGALQADSIVLIAGLTNHYSHYIATSEEYQAQRYEASSTLYGPNTLAAYQQEYSALASLLAQGKQAPPVPQPDIDSSWAFLLIEDAPGDVLPSGVSSYGTVDQDVGAASFQLGQTASASFWAGNPNNNLSISTYCTVEQYDNTTSSWVSFLEDGEIGTHMSWSTPEWLQSLVACHWAIPSSSPSSSSRPTTNTIYTSFSSVSPPPSSLPALDRYRDSQGILGNSGAIFSASRGLISVEDDVVNHQFRLVHSGYSKAGTDGTGATTFYQGVSSPFTVPM